MNANGEAPEDEPVARSVPVASIMPGPLRRESLTLEQEQQARTVFPHVSPFLGVTFEEFEITFLRDSDPQSELDLLSKIVAAHQAFLKQQPGATPKTVFKCVLVISMCGTKPDDVPQALWDELNRFVGA